tara:strand:- start:48460 stop:49335 length:876 start_codon:yes stop_codon:yes gene_type:complete
MISILIPCFDYNAHPLASRLEKQALALNINFEIICIDDGSFSSKNEINQKINLLTNAKFIESRKNLGRIKNRILLAEKSQYKFLLFVDVDTMPMNEDFIKKYIYYSKNESIIFGGCKYKIPEKENLKYKFGKKREEINSNIRNKNPYKYISSSNFLCRKDILLNTLRKIKNVSYGNDYIFGSILKNEKINVLHVNNQIIIESFDSNEEFIIKTQHALLNLLKCNKERLINKHSISILSAYKFLDNFYLKTLFLKSTNIFRKLIEKNLEKQNPNLFLFDLYRLRYMCLVKDF